MSIKNIQKKLDRKILSASIHGDTLAEPCKRKFAAAGTAMMVPAAMSMVTAFADEVSDITTSIGDGLGNAYKVMRALAIPIAAIGIALSAFYIFTDADKGMDKAKKTILYTVIGLAIVLLGPWLISKVAEWFDSSNSDAVFDGVAPT